MKSQLSINRELNRLSRRIEHLRDRVLTKKKLGLNYSSIYVELENCIGRMEALKWVKN